MSEHNKNFYSLEELKRTRDSLEGYLDNEEVYYFVGAIRYACDEIERLNNIRNKAIDFLKENACIDEDIRYFCDDLRYDDCKILLDILEGDDKE